MSRDSETLENAESRTRSPEVLAGLFKPLQHLVAAAELLDRQRLTPEARACARAILQSGRTLLGVIEDARMLGSVGAAASEPQPVSPAELLEEVEALWRLQTDPSAGRLLLSTAGPPGVLAVTDPALLKQAMNALISRALETCPTGVVEGALRLAPVDEREAMLGFTIRHARPAAAAAHDGGLALAEAAADRLGGVLRRSDLAGDAEEITIALPVTLAEPEAEAVPERPAVGAQAHILIVDDNATNRMVAAALCEMFGCTTETAEDGVEAVEAARASRFDLILMDIKMPRMDGVEATRAIRRLPGALGRTPIVALTANGDAEAAKHYMANGMDGVVEKPIKPDLLLATLQSVLEAEGGSGTDAEGDAEAAAGADGRSAA